jgi:hypothetical protein
MSENEAREELSGARQQSEEISGERRTNELVVPQSVNKAVAVTVDTDQVHNIASAVAQLQDAIKGMQPDDVCFEFKQDKDGSVHLRLRAYRSHLR